MTIIGELTQREQTIIQPKTGERPIIRVEPPQYIYEVEKAIIRGKQTLWYIWIIIEILLLFRFLLKLFSANPANSFNVLVNVFSTPFMFLFAGLFSSTSLQASGSIIEWSTLVAMIVYTIIAWLTSLFFKLVKPIDPKEAEEKVEKSIL